VDRASATGKDNRFTACRHVTPLHHKLVDTMLRLPIHLIVTLRTKAISNKSFTETATR
jgi:hypothetical protein